MKVPKYRVLANLLSLISNAMTMFQIRHLTKCDRKLRLVCDHYVSNHI